MFFVNKDFNARYIFVFGGFRKPTISICACLFIHDNGIQNIKFVDCTGLFEVRRRYCLKNGEFETISPPKYQLLVLLLIIYFIKFLPFSKIKKYLGIYYDETCKFKMMKNIQR